VFVEYTGGTLTVAELGVLVPRISGVSSVPRSLTEGRIGDYLVGQMALQEGERRRLLEEPEHLEGWYWKRQLILATAALLHKVEQRFVEPSEDVVRGYFEAHREDFTRDPHFQISGIRFDASPDRLREAYSQAETLIYRMEKGELGFQEAAEQLLPSATQSGSYSESSLRRLFGPNVVKTVKALHPGESSDLVQEGNQLWILRLDAVEEARPWSWEEARESARESWGKRESRRLEEEVRGEWFADLEIAPVH
jgi:hypothetical protein